MTNLITEARELCEKAETLVNELHTERLDYITEYLPLIDALQSVPELCNALEKAAKKNEKLMRELSQLARESVERGMALARLEADVEHAITATRWTPVAERLPERNDKILAYTPPKPGYAELCEVTRGFMAQLGKRSGITHWMPLPAPPKEGE